MASRAFDVVRERTRQGQAARARATAAAVRRPVCAEDRLGCSVPIGARVVDLVTGEEGIVIAAGTENVIVPTAR